MREGKASQAVLDRSVLRPLRLAGVLSREGEAYGKNFSVIGQVSRKDPSVIGQVPGKDVPVIGQVPGKDVPAIGRDPGEDGTGRDIWLSASNCGTVGGAEDLTAEMIILGAGNNLACSGARMEQIMLSVLFPSDGEESGLKNLICEVADTCRRYRIRVCGGHTQISSAVSRPVLSVTGFSGSVTGDFGRRISPGQELVMTGYAGAAGGALLALNREEELLGRFPPILVDGAKQFVKELSVWNAAQVGTRSGVYIMHDVSQGGIFGALWEMAENAGIGLEVWLKSIPIRQETIEVCEFFGRNPYQMYGQGALLLAADRGEELVRELEREGIAAAVIGRFTEGKGRIIRNGEDLRCLDRPAQDELWSR